MFFLLLRFTILSNIPILPLTVPFPPVCGISCLCVNIYPVCTSWQKVSGVWHLDLSYMSLQINVNPFTSKMVFLPDVFLGLEFNEVFELHLIPLNGRL